MLIKKRGGQGVVLRYQKFVLGEELGRKLGVLEKLGPYILGEVRGPRKWAGDPSVSFVNECHYLRTVGN